MSAHGETKGPTAAPTGSSAPSTPQRLQNGAEIDKRVDSINKKWNLGIQLRGKGYSPSKSSPNDLRNKIYGRIQYLFYKNEPALDLATDNFNLRASALECEDRLKLLYKLLSNASNMDEPPSRDSTQNIGRPRRLASSFREAASTTQPKHPLRADRQEERESSESYVTAIDPGSPTDEDTSDEMSRGYKGRAPSLSPSPSSRSAHILPQASKHVSFKMTRKRPREDSDRSENPKKLTKILKGKQISKTFVPSHAAQSTFKRPTLQMAPSFRANADEPSSSANTSFNTTIFSSQETANTATTSFTSYTSEIHIDEEPISKPKWSRTSSTTMGSLNDDELLHATIQSERVLDRGLVEQDIQRDLNETFSQESNGQMRSTFGSVDEEGLINTSFEVENAQLASDPTPCVKARKSEMPEKMSHNIRDIPKQNLFVDQIPKELEVLPYHVLFICQRISLESGLCLQKIVNLVAESDIYSNSKEFWNTIDAHLQNLPKPVTISHDPDRLWQSENRRFDGYTFKGNLTLNSKRIGPVMSLKLFPVQADRSCRLQRMFGSDRFLYLDLPKLNVCKTGHFVKQQMKQIQKQLKEWRMKDHWFLGRKWRAFHTDILKRGKTTRRSDLVHDERIVLFATEGNGIKEPYTVHQMLNKFLPLALNKDQSFCKAFARIDLGLSRTIPTFVFKSEQIERVHDRLSTDDHEDTRFDDWGLDWPLFPKKVVMDDGCCTISVGAAIEIWRLLKEATGVTGPMPSAFQGRIGGAKGLWIISAEPFTKDPYHLKPWIKINDSQWKFNPPNDDSVHHRTFEVLKYSSEPSPSELHISFIPILEDRGVPKSVISDFVHSCLEKESTMLLEILKDAVKVHDWVYRNGAKTKPGEDAPWQAGQPVTLEERILFLLESGFHPLKSLHLARSLERLIEAKHMFQEAKLRIPLVQSTFLYGVADPLGVLKPGEIHIQFSTSKSFTDEMTDEAYLFPRETEVLVARQPACRPSDAQKVRKIVHPELSHLVDVAVFPSKGQFPLAGKLQGGDYDGDIFWICWEPSLVQPFYNAPAPVHSPNPSDYGIRTRKEKLKDIMDMNDPEDVDNFLREAFTFRDHPSLLGQATNLAEKQAYRENRIYSEVLSKLYDMHDLLVDAAKQGYVLTNDDYNGFVRKVCKNPKQPAYKRAIEDCTNSKASLDTEKLRRKTYRYNPDNILDYLYFEVVRAQNLKTMDKVREILPQVAELDEALTKPIELFRQKKQRIFKDECHSLLTKLEAVNRMWNAGWHRKIDTGDRPTTFIDECYRKYLAIQPDNPDNDYIAPYLERDFPTEPCRWDRIKASALYSKYQVHGKHSFIFTMAGDELARIKASSYPKTRAMVLPIRSNLKPKRVRGLVQYDADDNEEEDEFASALEDLFLDEQDSWQ